MANHIHSDMLTKNPICATNAFGSPRVIPMQWKGMSVAQIEEIKNSTISNKRETADIES